MPLDILFADAAVELVSPDLAIKLQSTRQHRKAPPNGELLDVADHNFAMQDLPNKEQRGRPDILHHCLLNTLDTPLARSGTSGVFFHLRDGQVFSVAPDTRIPRNYNRFLGVLTQLLLKTHVPEEKPFHMWLVAGNLAQFLASRSYDHVCVLTRTGVLTDVPRHFEQGSTGKWLCVIGAFQEGYFQSRTLQELRKQPFHLMSIAASGLSAGTVASRVMYAYELAMDAKSRTKG